MNDPVTTPDESGDKVKMFEPDFESAPVKITREKIQSMIREVEGLVVLKGNMPTSLSGRIDELNQWADENQKDAKNDAFRFWMIKIPAMIATAASAALTYFGLNSISVVVAVVATFCVLIDGMYPGGQLRKIHYQAYFDIRRLTWDMRDQWDIKSTNVTNPAKRAEIEKSIIELSRKERRRIETYVRDAEVAMGNSGN